MKKNKYVYLRQILNKDQKFDLNKNSEFSFTNYVLKKGRNPDKIEILYIYIYT